MKLFDGRFQAASAAKRNRLRLRGWVKGILGMLLSLGILCGTVLAIGRTWVRPLRHSIKEESVSSGLPQAVSQVPADHSRRPVEKEMHAPKLEAKVPKTMTEGIYNILLLGTDDDGFRTDTIMLAHLDTNTKTAALLSVPRDSAVLDADGNLMKLNSVYNGGKETGVSRLEDTLETLLGFRPDSYVLVDLEGFGKAVDLMGGVWFDVPQDMYYEDPSQNLMIDLNKGYQLLNGQQALGLVRYRKGYATQDIQRTEVQQAFLLAAAKQMLRAGNLLRIGEFLDLASNSVLTDLSAGNMLWLAKELLACDTASIKSCTLAGDGVYVDGVCYYALFENALLRTINEMFNPYDRELTLEDICVITPEKAAEYETARYEAPVKPAEPEKKEETEQSPQNDPRGLEPI